MIQNKNATDYIDAQYETEVYVSDATTQPYQNFHKTWLNNLKSGERY